MQLNDMVSLTFVNISINQFSGLLLDIFSRPLMTLSYFGNPTLCQLGKPYSDNPSSELRSKRNTFSQKEVLV